MSSRSRDLAVLGVVAIPISEMAFMHSMTTVQYVIPLLAAYFGLTKIFSKKLDSA